MVYNKKAVAWTGLALLTVALLVYMAIYSNDDSQSEPTPDKNVNRILYSNPNDISKLVSNQTNEFYGPKFTDYISSNFTLELILVPNNISAYIGNSYSRFPIVQLTGNNKLRLTNDFSQFYDESHPIGVPIKVKIVKTVCDFAAYVDDILVHQGPIIENTQFGNCDNGKLTSETNTLLIQGYGSSIKEIKLT